MSSSPSSSSNGGKKPASGGRCGPAIRTLADLNRRPSVPGFPGVGSDHDEPQEYYAGGEKSGMLVQDPTNRNDADSIFEQARQIGALQSLPPGVVPGQSFPSKRFTGTGRLLSGEFVPSAAQPPQDVVHNAQSWNNGFTVDNGPLRSFDDAQNADFMEGDEGNALLAKNMWCFICSRTS